MSFAFVASPYTSDDREVETLRHGRAVHFVGWATLEGMIVFSPIVHSIAAARPFSLPTDFSFWLKANLTFLRASSRLIVLAIDGWDRSAGVAAERAEARRFRLDEYFFAPRRDGWIEVPQPVGDSNPAAGVMTTGGAHG